MITHFFCLIITELLIFIFFFFNDTATTEIYTLSLHDALPICCCSPYWWWAWWSASCRPRPSSTNRPDRKSTRLNSSHSQISYAVFCLKKKKKKRDKGALIRSKNRSEGTTWP